MKPRNHCKERIAHANGATIQYKGPDGRWYTIEKEPYWENGTEYRASIADVEGKPCFVGEKIFHPDGAPCTVSQHDRAEWLAKCSWNPPKPKTITVTIPRPNNEVKISTYYYPALAYTNPDDQAAAIEAIKDAMK